LQFSPLGVCRCTGYCTRYFTTCPIKKYPTHQFIVKFTIPKLVTEYYGCDTDCSKIANRIKEDVFVGLKPETYHEQKKIKKYSLKLLDSAMLELKNRCAENC